MRKGRLLVTTLGTFMVASLLSSCTAGGCEPHQLAPLDEMAAGIDRATNCPVMVEIEGVEYEGWGCPPVRRALLGSVIAEDGLYKARSIDAVPRQTAVAVHEHNEPTEDSCAWKLFVAVAFSDLDPGAANDLARRVRPAGNLT